MIFKDWLKNLGGLSETKIKSLRTGVFVKVHLKFAEKIIVFNGYVQKKRGKGLNSVIFIKKHNKYSPVIYILDVNCPDIVDINIIN